MRLAGRRVLLGVSGGIASYKACTIARRLTEAGAAVDAVLTAAASEFVRPITFEALTGRPVLASLWERDRALSHIHLARDAELIVLAPATANLLARAAVGIADDLLTAILLATRAPVLMAPAMNDEMYAHPATQANVDALERRGWVRVGPATGALAEGPSDRPGRMAEPEEIVAFAERLLRAPASPLAGRCVVVTAGPTREFLDAVRVVTNPSSGRMGYAIAAAAFARGARVLLLSGPSALPTPWGVERRDVRTTEELHEAVEDALPGTDVLVMAAAPADYRPARRAAGKRARGEGRLTVELEATADILESTAAARRPGGVAVGFALEHGDGLERARAKLKRKALDLIVLNRADDPEGGFEVETNRVSFVTADGSRDLGVLSKREVAERLLDEIETRL